MLLNRKFYQDLWEKYQNIETLALKFNDPTSILTIKIILDHYKRKKPIHVNFQSADNSFQQIAHNLFIELANKIFHNDANFPQLKIGDKVKSKNPIRVGTPNPRFLTFVISRINSDKYFLENSQFSIKWERNFADIVQKFIPISQNAQTDTLTQFAAFFETLNGKQVHDFTPTYFERKSVFIAPKTFYDSLHVKNKIPTTYFPNPREESNPHETKSIPALPDSIMYFVPRYKVCYNKILLKGIKIDTIVVFDTEESEIDQIIQEKNRFSFNLIVLTNKTDPIKYSQLPCWNWFKEEIELINSL